ncbi:hypothetical protein YC2023_089227 [Brassica napus]
MIQESLVVTLEEEEAAKTQQKGEYKVWDDCRGHDPESLCPLHCWVFLGEVFNEEVLQGSKLDLGSARVKLEGECFGRVLRLQKWSDECAKIGFKSRRDLTPFREDLARALKSHMVSEPGSSEPELSFRKSTALISAQTKPLKTLPAKGGWRGVMNLKPKLLVQELITSGYKKDEAKRSRLSDVSGSQEVFLVHHPSELKEEDFAHCVEQWRVEKEVVMRHCNPFKLVPVRVSSLRGSVEAYMIQESLVVTLEEEEAAKTQVFLGEVFNEEVLQGSKLDLGSARVKLEGECFGRVLRLQKWSDECAKIGFKSRRDLDTI